MKTFKTIGALVVLTGLIFALAFAEPAGILAAIAGMFPWVLVHS